MNIARKNIWILLVAAFGFTNIATAQVLQQKVGNNPTMINPNAVLELESNNKGLLLPRLNLTSTDSFAPLTEHVAGMIVYNMLANGTGATAVTPGYYYNDGTQWVRIGSDTGTVQANNGLTLNTTTSEVELGGTLNRVTNIDMNTQELSFSNSFIKTYFNENGLYHQGQNSSSRNAALIQISSPDKDNTNGSTRLDLQAIDGANARILAGGDAKGLAIGTHNTAVPAPIVFNTVSTANAAGTTKMTLTPSGELVVNASSSPSITIGGSSITPKLHVAGDVSTTGKYYTVNSVYADYVFEKYFDGVSAIDAGYEFKSLGEVAAFIKANKHLPGVTPIGDLQKSDAGYTIDLTNLSVELLEKTEELFLHTIEQQQQIDQQKQALQELTERITRLEKLLSDK